MLLGVDGRLANESKKAGVGVFCTEVLRAMAAHRNSIALRVYLDAPPRPDFPLSTSEAEICVLPPGPLWLQRALARELRRNPPDVFFSPVTQIPILTRCPAAAMVHDLAILDFGEHFTWSQRLLGRVYLRLVIHRAAHLIALSEATQSHLLERFRLDPERVSVSLAASARAFTPGTDSRKMREVRERYGLSERFVLYVGRLQPRKNVARLIEAFGYLCERVPTLPHHLIIAGDEGWLASGIYEAAQESPCPDRIRFVGYVAEEDLPALMSMADVLALVSLWEGFGIPVAEAMACGTAVVTSNCSSLPEVAGDAAVLVDPYDVHAISEALERVITDDSYRNSLERKGLAQAAKFTWDEVARRVLDAARKSCRSKPSRVVR